MSPSFFECLNVEAFRDSKDFVTFLRVAAADDEPVASRLKNDVDQLPGEPSIEEVAIEGQGIYSPEFIRS